MSEEDFEHIAPSQFGVDAENTASFSNPNSDALPRYLSQTLSSTSSNSAAAETERIARSFRSGNFYSIKKLPTRLAPGGVEESRKKQIAKTLSDKPTSVYKARVTNSYFTPFTYSRTEYNKVKENEREEAQYQRLTTLSFSRKPFTYAASKVRLKNEDLFGDEEYKFPVLGPGRGKMELSYYVRKDFTDSSKMIHGPFSVVGPRRGQKEVPRDEIGIWSKEIFDKLSEDWGHLRFSIKFTGDDELVVSFDVSVLPQREDGSGFQDKALSRYMVTMARIGVAAERRLKKRGDRWRVLEWEEVYETRPTPNPTASSTASSSSAVEGDGGGEGRDSPQGSQPTMKQFLVFSFYAPWCVSSHVTAHKGAAKNERLRTRRAVRTRLNTLRTMSGRVDLDGTCEPAADMPSFAPSASSCSQSQSMPSLVLPLSGRNGAQSTESGRSLGIDTDQNTDRY